MHDEAAALLAYRRHFGDRLRHLRARAGLTQEALADRAGLDKQAVSLIENARQIPRLDTLWHLARALDLTVSDLTAEET
ncbi:helix-turn-helix domain-containing protein [Streptomyces olivaceus]|uniref:helix-turn-helix transcriptional regulator n=1 Tax=Streptomyces olivaceus TaxID=47716 RepID=UPI001CCD5350|nr:helix-turn-helix transcriptional regulator [Streptomyces olivaceus]MBZ6258112.1 helix-turn-helix domain-containing protein [Streptomyces olivaceus]